MDQDGERAPNSDQDVQDDVEFGTFKPDKLSFVRYLLLLTFPAIIGWSLLDLERLLLLPCRVMFAKLFLQ